MNIALLYDIRIHGKCFPLKQSASYREKNNQHCIFWAEVRNLHVRGSRHLRPGALPKAGDGNPLQDLESKIIYTLAFYIPLLENKLQENYEKSVVSYNFET